MAKSSSFLKVCKECKGECCKMGGPGLPRKELNKILEAGYKDHSYSSSKDTYKLKTKNGVCPYLKKDFSCEIQDVKPLACLCWPVFPIIKNKKKKYIIFDCPLTQSLSKREILDCLKEAVKISPTCIKACWDDSTSSKSERKIILKRFKKFKWRDLN